MVTHRRHGFFDFVYVERRKKNNAKMKTATNFTTAIAFRGRFINETTKYTRIPES